MEAIINMHAASSEQEIEKIREKLEIISEKNRFAILTVLLAIGKPVSFSDLLKITGLNPGTLNNHLKKLEKIGVIEKEGKAKWKRNEKRSYYQISEEGEKLLNHLGIGKSKEALRKWLQGKTAV